MLDLARLALPQPDVQHQAVLLRPLVQECWQPWSGEAHRRGLCLELDVAPELERRTDPVLLRRVIANLFENTVTYSEERGSIEVAGRLDGGRRRMNLSNPAPDAPPDVASRAFDAFWRADASRGPAGRLTGLGLALCRRIIEALRGQIETSDDGQHFSAAFEIDGHCGGHQGRGAGLNGTPGVGRSSRSLH